MIRNSLNIGPWKKLCKLSKQKIAKGEDLTEEEQGQAEQDVDFVISSFKVTRQEINKDF